MADKPEHDSQSKIPGEGVAIVLESPSDVLKREEADRKKRDDEYKQRQLRITEGLAVLTFFLVLGNGIYDYFMWEQSETARIAADAAQESAAAANNAARLAGNTLISGRQSATDALGEMQKQSKAMEDVVTLSSKQFRLMQASDIGVVGVSIIDHSTTRFAITNFGNLAARNVTVRVKEDHFPSLHAMIFFQYDPLSELSDFRSDQTRQHHREALTKEESAETVSGTGPIWRSVGHLRRNDQWSYDYTFPFPDASPPQQAVICLLVNIDWDDALEHRKGSACQLFTNAKPVGCQQFVLGLPPPKFEGQ